MLDLCRLRRVSFASALGQNRVSANSLQNETQKAVSFMEEGVKDVDNSLRFAEDASLENVHLHQAVENMFSIIQQLNKRSLDYGKTIKKVEQSSTDMRQTVVVLQNSAETVRRNANKLQKLVGQFEVSSNLERMTLPRTYDSVMRAKPGLPFITS